MESNNVSSRSITLSTASDGSRAVSQGTAGCYSVTPSVTPTATATATFTSTPTPTGGSVDADGDGDPDAQEIALGKNPNVYCATMRADVDMDHFVTALDLAAVGSVFLQTVPPAPARYNQGPAATRNGTIDALDLAAMGAVFFHNISECA